MAQVKRTNQTRSRLTSELDLFSDQKLSPDAKEKASQEIGEFLVEQINIHLSQSKSPVSGESFKALSKKYKKFKEDEGHSGSPNLEFSGQMKDQISFRPTSKGIEIGVFGDAALRADGHNNFSGESKIPTRRFLPGEAQNFKQSISKEIDKIINDAIASGISLTRSDVAEIKDSKELFSTLREIFPDFSRAEIVDAVLRNNELSGLLDEFNLLRFLNG